MRSKTGKLNASSAIRPSLWLVLLAAFAASQAGCSAPPEEDKPAHSAKSDDFEYSDTAGELPAPGAWNPPADVRTAGAAQLIPYHDAPVWNGGKNCSVSLHPGTKQLGDFLKAKFPGRVSSYRGYACRPNTTNSSKTSVHGTGRALDVFIPLDAGRADNGKGDEVANWLILNAQAIGVQYIVWDHADWGGSRMGEKMSAYGGPHPHQDHIHLELTPDGAAKKTPWFNGMETPSTPYLTAGHFADFDGDGKPDIAGIGSTGESLWIHRNTSTPGSVSKADGKLVSSGWDRVRNYMVTDYDGDGKADILGQADNALLLWRITGTADALSTAPFYSFGTGWNAFGKFLPPADLDGDGKPEIAGFSLDGSELWVHRNTSTPGNPSMGDGQFVSSGWDGVRNYMMADYDGDGRDDILGQADDSLLLWLSTATAAAISVAPPYSFGTGWNAFSEFLPPADYDGDGKPDIAVISDIGDDLWVYRNTGTPGNPSSAPGTLLSSGWGGISDYMGGDFDGDKKYDIAGLGGGSILIVWLSTSNTDQFSVAPLVELEKNWNTFGRFLTTAPIR